jgi:hypothetical protein
MRLMSVGVPLLAGVRSLEALSGLRRSSVHASSGSAPSRLSTSLRADSVGERTVASLRCSARKVCVHSQQKRVGVDRGG